MRPDFNEVFGICVVQQRTPMPVVRRQISRLLPYYQIPRSADLIHSTGEGEVRRIERANCATMLSPPVMHAALQQQVPLPLGAAAVAAVVAAANCAHPCNAMLPRLAVDEDHL